MSAIRLARAATGPRQAPEVRRRLPRPRRRPARRGRLGPRHAGHPGLARACPRPRPRRHDRRALERPRGGRAPRSPSTSSRRSWPSPTRPTWASSRPRPASSSCCASSPTDNGALLVFDEVITGFRVAPGGAQELTGVIARPDGDGQGHRRRAAGRGLRRPGELMERIAPAGDVYQAGTLCGNPLAVAAGLADAAAARRGGLRPARRHDRARSPPGCARPRATRPVQVAATHRPADRLLLRRAGDATTRAPPPATSRPTPPGAARCSPAASTRRRRSSRPGSRRSRTRAEHVERTLEAAARGVRGDRMSDALARSWPRPCGPTAACWPTP